MGLLDFRRKRQRKKYLLRNGRYLLEEMITSFNGKSNPIRSFSAPAILKATNNFNSRLYYRWDGRYQCYKCIIEDHPVLVKRSWLSPLRGHKMENIARDIAVSSQMSSHKNVLKLLGCCLEFPSMVLVFEYAEKGRLNNSNGGLDTGETLPWNIRLKIAKETASAIAYLHTAFPKRMVHRDIKPSNIFLDEKWTAKIMDFSDSISIPDGEPDVELETDTIWGTAGFLAPEYSLSETPSINESIDVFGFGTTLLILITGTPSIYSYRNEDELPNHVKVFMADAGENSVELRDLVANASEKCRLIEILDPRLVEDAVAEEALELQQMQWKAFIELALKCVRDKREDRPDMIEVAKELARIEKSTRLSDMILDKECEPVVPPVDSSGNIQTQRVDNRVAGLVHRQHRFHYFLREYQYLLALMLIFYLVLQWNTYT